MHFKATPERKFKLPFLLYLVTMLFYLLIACRTLLILAKFSDACAPHNRHSLVHDRFVRSHIPLSSL